MTCINCENKIINVHNSLPYEIINNTKYFPVCIFHNKILMSDGKIYIVKYGYDKLSILKLSTKENYVCDPIDFTGDYVKIGSPGEYYEINLTCLIKINIAAKNPHNIIKNVYSNSYYYVDVDNKLMMYGRLDGSYTFLDDNVDLLLDTIEFFIVYVKNNIIYCSKHNNFMITDTYQIEYSGR